MKAFTCHREEAIVLGGAIRILVLNHGRHHVRLGIDAPATIEVTAGERTVLRPRRRDLIAWHPDPHRLCRQIVARYPAAADEVRVLRSGVAYFGGDPCLFTELQAYTLGHADATKCCAQHPKQPSRSA